MTCEAPAKTRRKPAIRRWIRAGFLLWAAFVILYLANSYRTRGVPRDALANSSTVSVRDGAAALEILPVSDEPKAALVFICGSGVSAHAYAPLLRPIAESGHPVFVVKLPFRFAALESHKRVATQRALEIVKEHPEIRHWVIAGHSLGGALACRIALGHSQTFSGLALVGTTHPKIDDLSALSIPVTKIYASNDGIAPPSKVEANKHLLPKATAWVEIKGGNHSQFGHYGHQLFDGKATISREAQQTATRAAIIQALSRTAK